MDQYGNVTEILNRWGRGEREALDELLPLVYGELRSLADNYMRRERTGHTLQPTALAHEAYLRLVGAEPLQLHGRAHFLAIAATAMRRILVEHARARGRKKRGGDYERVSLGWVRAASGISRIDLIALDQALERLSVDDPRKARVVELLYFGGLTSAEAAEVLEVTSRTVERDWQYARLWLLRELSGKGGLREAEPGHAGS